MLGLASFNSVVAPDGETRWVAAKAPGQADTGKSTRREAFNTTPHFRCSKHFTYRFRCMLLDGRQTDDRTVGRKKMVDRDGTIRRKGGVGRGGGIQEVRATEGEERRTEAGCGGWGGR